MDSTENFLENSGHTTMVSTERRRNSGHQILGRKLLFEHSTVCTKCMGHVLLCDLKPSVACSAVM